MTEGDEMRALWLGTEGGSVLHGCHPKDECEDLAIRFAMAHLIHPHGVNNGAAISACCQSSPGSSCHRAFQGDSDSRMAAVLDASLAMVEGRENDALNALVQLASTPRRCPIP